MKHPPLKQGDVFDVPYPFIQGFFCDVTSAGGSGEEVPTWNPGTWNPGTRPRAYGPDNVESVADAMGAMILEVVSVHRPAPRYHTRVFFVRRWRRPDGHVVGDRKLRVTTETAFRRRVRGYMHDFRLAGNAQVDSAKRQGLTSALV